MSENFRGGDFLTYTVQNSLFYDSVYSVSKNFSKQLGIFNPNFSHLSHVPNFLSTLDYKFYSITCNFDEVMPY